MVSANGALFAQAAEPPPEFIRQAPANAPNVIIILLDDVGFGTTSTFGGPVATPNLDALARQGLSYTRFHTTGICSPTRASLLTGRNPHRAGIGAVMNSADSRPGYSGVRSADTASIAQLLHLQGYATAAFGKWHQTPPWESSQAGPFDRWPTGDGFDYFYGFQGGETDQFEPTLYEGTVPVDRPDGEDYHLTEDLADRSIAWMQEQKALRPDHPFLLYFAPGAIHAPIQVPQQWIDKYRGQFDQGWDRLREQTFARQKAMGLFPKGAVLPPRPEEIPAWDSLSPEEQRFASRAMEGYAAFMAHTDAQVGRLLDSLRASGEFDNTLIFYVVGDNGASLEGGLEGSLNYMAPLIGLPQDSAGRLARIGDLGTARAYTHVNSGWAWASNAPFQWGKTMPAWLGAVRNPLVVSWPDGIASDMAGGRRSQFGHVNDIVPTILDVLGLALPEQVDGVEQAPLDGSSLRYSFADAKAPEQHRIQYFEVFGSRSIYRDGWFAAADHGRLPWTVPNFLARPVSEDRWTLYNLGRDPVQANDLAAKEPERLAAMEGLFMEEAKRNNVLPLGGQVVGRSGLPSLGGGRSRVTFLPGTRGVPEDALPAMANRSWSIAAEIETSSKVQGVVGAVGGSSAGWSLWIDAEGFPVFTYRLFDLQTLSIRGAQALAPGAHRLTVAFAYDGKGFARGGELALSVDGGEPVRGRLVASTPHHFTIDETFDLGRDRGSPVAAYPMAGGIGYPLRGGKLGKFTISLPDAK
ncbi:MAG: arylsulfatase [Sphingomonadaceae bacterium]|nr:arylsulfatase [Sphingomonadaceae bacterium]